MQQSKTIFNFTPIALRVPYTCLTWSSLFYWHAYINRNVSHHFDRYCTDKLYMKKLILPQDTTFKQISSCFCLSAIDSFDLQWRRRASNSPQPCRRPPGRCRCPGRSRCARPWSRRRLRNVGGRGAGSRPGRDPASAVASPADGPDVARRPCPVVAPTAPAASRSTPPPASRVQSLIQKSVQRETRRRFSF